MSRAFVPVVVTANALLSGEAVWLTADDHWSPRLAEAELILDAARAEQRLRLALGQPDRVVGPYLAEAGQGGPGLVAGSLREQIRAEGPSNYDHGKTARAA